VARVDVVVIGADVNGLTAGAILAKAGRRVVVLDIADHPDALADELPPEFTVDAVGGPRWISSEIRQELDLDRHGLELLPPEDTLACFTDGAEPVIIRRHQRLTIEALQRHSARDAERWPAFAERVARLAGFLGWLYHRPPPPLKTSGLADWLDLAALGRRAHALGRTDLIELARVLPMPIADLVEDTFDDARLKACIAAGAVAGIQHGPRSGGTTFAWLHQQVGAEPGAISMHQRVRGGGAAVVRAVARAAQSAGAEIRAGAPVAGIKTVGPRATGIVFGNGDEIDAACVVSSVGTKRTLLDLVGPAMLDPELVRAIQNIRYRGVTARVHLVLDGLPAFSGLPDDALAGAIVIAPSLDGIERAYDDAKYGRVSSDPILEVRIPSIADPGVAPAGKRVMSISVQYAPYRLRDGDWDEGRRSTLGDAVISRLSAVAPGLERLVLHRQVLTPADLAGRYGLPEGSVHYGEIALDQALFMRPIPECARYLTPIHGLYLCGADMHPGRGVAGGAGRLAAREVLKAL
jgi:phytoene dehydrogenase-like protein